MTRALLAGGAALIAVSVAASRALLGVHWLTDVIAGLAIGWGWFMIVGIIFGGRAQRLGAPVADPPLDMPGECATKTASGPRDPLAKLRRRLGADGTKPLDHVDIASFGNIARRQVVPTEAVHVGTLGEQVVGDVPVPAMTGAPERSRHLVGRWWLAREVDLDTVEQPQRSGFPHGRCGSALQESAGRIPLTESRGIGDGCAAGDHGATGFDVRAGIEQRIEHGYIVAARRPVQWRSRCAAR